MNTQQRSQSCSLLPCTPATSVQYGAFSVPSFGRNHSTGFSSPSEDIIEQQLDLNDHLVSNRAATFFVRAHGDSMKSAGIFSGDLLIVDRSITPQHNAIILAILNGEFMVRRLYYNEKQPILASEHPSQEPITITEDTDFEIWGIVTNVIHNTTAPP